MRKEPLSTWPVFIFACALAAACFAVGVFEHDLTLIITGTLSSVALTALWWGWGDL